MILRQRLGLPAGAVEGEHQLRAQAFSEWMRSNERLQLTDELGVATGGEVGFGPILERHKSKLLEPRDFGLREGLVGEVGKRRSAPHPQ